MHQCPAPQFPILIDDPKNPSNQAARPWWSDAPLPEDEPASAPAAPWGLPRNLAQAILRRRGSQSPQQLEREHMQVPVADLSALRELLDVPKLDTGKRMAEMYERLFAAQDRLLAYVASVWAGEANLRQLLGRIERRSYVNRPGEADFYLHPEPQAVAYDHERGAFYLQPFNRRQHPELILTTIMRPIELPTPQDLEGIRYTMNMDYVSILGVVPDAILRDASNTISIDLLHLRQWKLAQSIGTSTPRGMQGRDDLHPGAVPWYWPALPPRAAWYEQQHGSRPHQATSAGE